MDIYCPFTRLQVKSKLRPLDSTLFAALRRSRCVTRALGTLAVSLIEAFDIACPFDLALHSRAHSWVAAQVGTELLYNMAGQPISSADRIRELLEIDNDVASMLQAAGQAVNALANRPLETADNEDGDTQMANGSTAATLDARKEAFQQNAGEYYTLLQSVIARLRRQAYALEEAGIISADANTISNITVKKPQPPPAPPGTKPIDHSERITNGGLGNHDIGWLNSRGNKVGADKERELVEDAKKLLEDVLAQDDQG